MGYDHYFLIAVDENKTVITEKDLDRMNVVYQELKKDDSFPVFGKVRRGKYSLGPTDDLLPSFMKFTMKFPDITFRLYLVYFDFESINSWIVKNDVVIKATEWNIDRSKELQKVMGIPVNQIIPRIDSFYVDKNITGVFNEEYDWDIDF